MKGLLLIVLTGILWHPIQVETLPPMQVPRAGHQLFALDDGSLVAVGGHTAGFVRTQTAESFRDGRWNFLPQPVYPHDGGFALRCRDGSVLLGGGSGEDFGIGQSWGLERYLPDSRSFVAEGILDRPRAFASALELQDGRIAVSGNWHADDAIALLDTATLGTAAAHVESHLVQESRFNPYLFETSGGNVLVLGSGRDARYQETDCLVESIQGEAFQLPLLKQWRPRDYLYGNGSYAIGPYAYLVPLISRDSTQVAILRVQDGQFSLLETDRPIPMTGPDGAPCRWVNLYADVPSRCAWYAGLDSLGRVCLAKVDYNPVFDGQKAQVSLYATARPVPGLPRDNWNLAVLPGARLALAGGNALPEGGNFEPTASAWIFHTEQMPVQKRSWWWLAGLLFLAAGLGLGLLLRKRPKPAAPASEVSVEEALLQKLEDLVQNQEVFRRKGLTVSDIAQMLNTNKTYVSVLVNLHFGMPFNDWINGFRVRYAARLLLEHPEMHLSDVADAAGFSGESSFFRIFKAVTGKTPGEWRSAKD